MSSQSILSKYVILKDRIASMVFGSGIEAYIVGGYLRDIVRGTRSKDIDFVVHGDIKTIVPELFSGIKKTVVEFKEASLVRVVIGELTLDFSPLEDSIEHDLSKRDFTMNAIAWSPNRGVIDPLKGIDDINNKTIRAVSKENFIDDPLRMLRAYRFAAGLGWRIDSDTRNIIKSLKALIRRSAPERVTLEFFKLLNSDYCLKALRECSTDGLLNIVLSLNKTRLSGRLKALSEFNSFLKKYDAARVLNLNEPFSQGLSHAGLFRAEILLYGADSKNLLRMSNAVHKRIDSAGSAFSHYRRIKKLTPEKLFNLFGEAGDAAMDFALLTTKKRIVDEAERFLRIKPLVPSEKVIALTGATGPEIGRLLKKMRCLQFTGKVNDYKSATAWLSKYTTPKT